MMFFDIVQISFRNLFRQKMRTVLTIASMMIGAFLIAIMLSVGNGLKQFMISQVTLFSNEVTIAVQSGIDMQETFGMGFGQGVQEYEDQGVDELESGSSSGETGIETRPVQGDTTSSAQELMEKAMLEGEDLEKIRKLPHVEEAAFETFVNSDYVRLASDDSKKLKLSLYAMPQGYLKMLSFSVKEDDLLSASDAIVLSDGYAEAWGLANADLVGKKVMVQITRVPVTGDEAGPGEAYLQENMTTASETKEFEMTIAGFFEKNMMPQMGFVGPYISSEINAYANNVSLDEYQNNEKAFELLVLVDDPKNVPAVDAALEKLDYKSMTTEETVGQIGVVFDVISAVLSSFGFVAMFVASIGIVNTLLMAIFERTREIGVMKAVGATRFTISFLFTVEALWLGLFGGASGLLFGFLIGRVANFVLHNGIAIGGLEIMSGYLAEYPTFNVSVFSLSTILSVMLVTTVVAFLAGLYPSLRAGRLDPIVALRHD